MFYLVFKVILTIFAPFTLTAICASHSALVAFTIFFETSRFLTVTTLRMEARVFLNLRFEGMWIAFNYGLHDFLPLLIALFITAVSAVAVWTATQAKSKAITIEFEALRFFAVATRAATRGTLLISHQKNELLI